MMLGVCMRQFDNTRNPILPLDIHIPDSEAHVMPNGNLYIYGSYDNYGNLYCSEKYYVVSTSDMKKWNIHEDVFQGKQVSWFNNPDAPKYESNDGGEPTEFVKKMQETTDEDDINFVLTQDLGKLPPLLFAPDCIEKDGKYYLYFCMADGSEGVAVSEQPEGPFEYRGILIDNVECDPFSWNNHGSIECFHGQWYIFYHRSSRNSKIFRYVKSVQDFQSLRIKAEGSGCMEIWMNNKKAGEIEVENGQQKNSSISMKAGEYELKLRFVTADNLEVDWLELG